MRALTLLDTIRRNGFARGGRARDLRPRMLTHTVTFKCDARCVMCDSWKIRSPRDLSLTEIDSIYAQLPRLDFVRLTGGEPFVRADFPEIVGAAQRRLRPWAVHVTTNGFQTDKIVRFCEQRERARPLHLLVSIDAVGAEHDRIRGRDDAYRRAFATLRALAPRQRALRLQLAVNQTLLDASGARHYRELRRELEPLGLRPQVVLAYDESATYSVEREREVDPRGEAGYATRGRFPRSELIELFELLERDLADQPWSVRVAKRYYLNGLRARLVGDRDLAQPRCAALHNHLRLFPNGDVPTCQFNGRVAGNLREEAFADVWRGARAEDARQWVRACPGCWAECELLPSAIYDGSLARPRRASSKRRLPVG